MKSVKNCAAFAVLSVLGCFAAHAARAAASATQAPNAGEGGVPQFEQDPAWPKRPSAWTAGAAISDIGADAQGNIWMITRPDELPAGTPVSSAPPPIIVFDRAGNYLRGWGSQAGPGYRMPSHNHDLELDSKGFVWVLGSAMQGRKDERGNAVPPDSQVLKFTSDGKFVMAIGQPGLDGSNKTLIHKGAAGLAYHAPTEELFVADGYGNSRVMVYDANSGRFKRMWGAYGNKPLDKADRKTTPLPEGSRSAPLVWGPVADRLQQFETVHDVAVSKDGLVYLADRGNRRVQVFTIEGKFITEQFVGLELNYDLQARGIAFSPDERFLYVAGTPGVYILNRRTLQILGTFRSGPAVQSSVGHHITTDPQGNIYLNYTAVLDADTRGSKTFGAVKFNFKGYSPSVKCCEPLTRLTVEDGFPERSRSAP